MSITIKDHEERERVRATLQAVRRKFELALNLAALSALEKNGGRVVRIHRTKRLG
ncbi:MAG: hypothetical protein JO233_10000 [Candidatus Eremiobacteraeota bacterium]|nr:hypothetical protein [Candidatus Eremiobacteraeota bacterium]